MFSLPRTITLLAICALAVCAIAPVAASAQGEDSPAGENYVLDVPDAGNDGTGDQGSQKGSNETGVPAAAADSADEGGLPILLLVLVATAAVGAGIAIVRRRSTQ